MKRLLLVVVLAVALLGLLAAPAFAHSHGHAAVFCVHPSGGDDTHNIQKAFDRAVKAGPGSTVQLSAGNFYMNNILVKDFRGFFKGAGKCKTVIDTRRGKYPNGPGVTVVPDVAYFSFLIGFVGGNVRVSNMSFDITAAEPAKPWGGEQTNLSGVFVVTGNASSAFDRVRFRAHAGDADGYNVEGDIVIFGPVGGTGGVHTVTRCSFAGREGIEVGGLWGGRLTVGGSPAMGNVFDNYYCCCRFEGSSDSTIVMSHSRMRASAGGVIMIMQGAGAPSAADLPPLPAPRYVIRDNTMLASKVTADDGSILAGAGGVLAWDDSWVYGEPSRLDAVIAHNTIVLDNGGLDGGINGIGAQGIRTLYNHISGTGVAGIDAGTDIYASFHIPAAPAKGWKIIGNDISRVNPLNAFGGNAAQIWLGQESSHCLVVGGCMPTTVLDQGTDNILINVNELLASSSARAAAPMNALSKTKLLKPVKKLQMD
jgi:hypothetical protein